MPDAEKAQSAPIVDLNALAKAKADKAKKDAEAKAKAEKEAKAKAEAELKKKLKDNPSRIWVQRPWHTRGRRTGRQALIYAALLVPSYLASWAFIQQPQWFYNQPNQESELLTKGLSTLLGMLPRTLRPDISISPALPT